MDPIEPTELIEPIDLVPATKFLELIKIHSVHKTETEGLLKINIDAIISGIEMNVDFILNENDNHGLAPAIRERIAEEKIEASSYIAPSAEQVRASMPSLTPRQLRLMLTSIGVLEQMVDDLLAGDPEGSIEWKWATNFTRDSIFITEIFELLELSPEQVDSLWMWAIDM